MLEPAQVEVQTWPDRSLLPEEAKGQHAWIAEFVRTLVKLTWIAQTPFYGCYHPRDLKSTGFEHNQTVSGDLQLGLVVQMVGGSSRHSPKGKVGAYMTEVIEPDSCFESCWEA